MKTYVLVEHSAYDFEHNIRVSVFATEELARKKWQERVDVINDFDGESDIFISNDPETMYFDAYREGRANEFEEEIYVVCNDLKEN